VSAYLGGEMVFGYGTEVNRQAWVDLGSKWETLDVREAALQDRAPVLIKTKGGFAVFVAKLDGKVYAMGNTCTHAGGPLNEGKWVGSDRCEIECPWHASRFCVKDGGARHGPATFDEPAFEVRVAADGRLEVRARD
jgi:nitrite reductase/ring-hydroxylating ferredoxin subunit